MDSLKQKFFQLSSFLSTRLEESQERLVYYLAGTVGCNAAHPATSRYFLTLPVRNRAIPDTD